MKKKKVFKPVGLLQPNLIDILFLQLKIFYNESKLYFIDLARFMVKKPSSMIIRFLGRKKDNTTKVLRVAIAKLERSLPKDKGDGPSCF